MNKRVIEALRKEVNKSVYTFTAAFQENGKWYVNNKEIPEETLKAREAMGGTVHWFGEEYAGI